MQHVGAGEQCARLSVSNWDPVSLTLPAFILSADVKKIGPVLADWSVAQLSTP